MVYEETPSFRLPEYSAAVPEAAVVKALEEIVDAKRLLNVAVRAITTSDSNGVNNDIDEFMRPFMTRSDIASGMVRAMDLMVPLADGTSWDLVISDLAEQAQQPEREEEPLVIDGIKAVIHRKRAKQIEERGILGVSIGSGLGSEVTYSLEELDLPTRPYRVLKENRINDLKMLAQLSIEDLRQMEGMGGKSIEQILDALDWNGWLIPEMSRGTPEEERLLDRPTRT